MLLRFDPGIVLRRAATLVAVRVHAKMYKFGSRTQNFQYVCFDQCPVYHVTIISAFKFSYLASNKKKTWKNLKQILTAERSLEWDPQDPTCKLCKYLLGIECNAHFANRQQH